MSFSDKELNILVVDDSEMTLKFAAHILNKLGLASDTALNGRLALEKMEKNPPDLLVTDLMMPEMDGFELITRMRKDPRLKQTHVIVITALGQVEDKVRALSLGASDYTVKPLNADEFKARVQAGLREIRLKKELQAAYQNLDREMQLVERLQRRLLPKNLPSGDRFEAAVSYRPCSRAGGDYYDCFVDGRGRWVFAMADVSGHGAAAAVLMGMTNALLKVLATAGNSAGEIVTRLNEALLEHIGEHPDFVSFFLALMDPDSRRLNICSAGHDGMFLIGPDKGMVQKLEAGGTVLGCFPGQWPEEFVDLDINRSLVLYTDGLVEAVNPEEQEFGIRRLRTLLENASPDRTPSELVEQISAGVRGFAGGLEPSDDETLFIIRFH